MLNKLYDRLAYFTNTNILHELICAGIPLDTIKGRRHYNKVVSLLFKSLEEPSGQVSKKHTSDPFVNEVRQLRSGRATLHEGKELNQMINQSFDILIKKSSLDFFLDKVSQSTNEEEVKEVKKMVNQGSRCYTSKTFTTNA